MQADEAEERRGRVAEAVRHARAAAGRGAVLRVLEVDPGADVPERWATLTPFPEARPTPQHEPARGGWRDDRPSLRAQAGAGARGRARERPVAAQGAAVETVREEWLVEDRWWTPEPIRRHYFELALADGRCEVVFRDEKGWFSQRA